MEQSPTQHVSANVTPTSKLRSLRSKEPGSSVSWDAPASPTPHSIKRKHQVKEQPFDSPSPSPKRIRSRKDCNVCTENKAATPTTFPPLDNCKHSNNVCKDCLRSYIHIKVKSDPLTGWAACKCPQCGNTLGETVARQVLTLAAGKKLDQIIKIVRSASLPPVMRTLLKDIRQRNSWTLDGSGASLQIVIMVKYTPVPGTRRSPLFE